MSNGSEAGGPFAAYQVALRAGRLHIQLCTACGRHIFYARLLCPHCAADTLEWRQASGGGTVYATTVVRRPARAGGPYNVALIELDEGVRLMSRVDGMAPEAVTIGLRVRASIADVNGTPAPVFHREANP